MADDTDDDYPDLKALLETAEEARVSFNEAVQEEEDEEAQDILWAEMGKNAQHAAELVKRDYPEVMETFVEQLIRELDDKFEFLIDELEYWKEDLEPKHRSRLRELIRVERQPRPKPEPEPKPEPAPPPRPKPDNKPADSDREPPVSEEPGDDDDVEDGPDDELETLADKVRAILDNLDENREEWINLTVDLAVTLRKARAHIPADQAFSTWFHDNGLAERINADDRAGLIHMGGNPTLLREILGETNRKSWQLIWREHKDRFRSGTKPTQVWPPNTATK